MARYGRFLNAHAVQANLAAKRAREAAAIDAFRRRTGGVVDVAIVPTEPAAPLEPVVDVTLVPKPKDLT